MNNTMGVRTAGGQSSDSTDKDGPFPLAEPVVRFDAVGMRYGRAPEVFSNLTFQLPAGSFHFLTGASGAGKTSLLSLIYLSQRAAEGRIEVFGRDVAAASREERAALRRRIGVVFQDIRLLDHLNCFDNVALPLRLAKNPPKAWRDDVSELLAWVGLGDRAGAYPATLSGGERQRVAIARAVVAKPDLILADEPTGNVDPAMSQKIMRLLTLLNRQGTTVLVASHDPVLVAGSGKPVLHLQDGGLTVFKGGVA